MNLLKERNKALKHAYSFARMGNFVWCQLWINRAGDFMPVTKKQLAYAQKLYNQSKKG